VDDAEQTHYSGAYCRHHTRQQSNSRP
jgi:hypothetical protein